MDSKIHIWTCVAWLGLAGCEASTPAPLPDGGGNPSVDAGRDAGDDTGDDGSVPKACELPPETGPCRATIPRYFHNVETGRCELFTYGGCEGNDNNFETLEACEEACDVPAPAKGCSVSATDSSLPGVVVEVWAERCWVRQGSEHRFRYTVTVPKDIAYTTVDSGGGCGSCRGSGPSPADMTTVRVQDADATVLYCPTCDLGCCAPTTGAPATIEAGDLEASLVWPGRQWNGPSDTGAPLGEPFPAGTYQVRVRFGVPGVGAVTAALPIEVVDGSGGDNPGAPGEASCKIGEVTYGSGTTDIADPHSCNRCECRDGGLACTEINCPVDCPVLTAPGRGCAACGPADGCEVAEYGCMPTCSDDDGCTRQQACVDGVCVAICV